MPQYWILGFTRTTTRQGKDPWGPLFCDWVSDLQEEPKPGVPFTCVAFHDEQWTEYFPIAVLGVGASALFRTLSNLSAILDEGEGHEVLQEALSEIAMAAYEAGRNGTTPPQNV